MPNTKISEMTQSPTIDLSLDTIKLGKQALIFVNTKRSAEKSAEDIASKIKDVSFPDLEKQVLGSLSSPTKQCKRLGRCIRRGIAFHHAGLASKQREIVEREFRKGAVKIICATPTLAIGVDLPAFRTIIRDLKRFGPRGLDNIPVLEYMQMSGRAGRPKYDAVGESICIASSEIEKESITQKYIYGEPEEIYSKLAVEPVLRTYTLSLVATGIVKSRKRLIEFFSKTFWAHHYQDTFELTRTIERTLGMLKGWGFICGQDEDFVSADLVSDDTLKETPVGKRVAELYIDPLTANYFLSCLKRRHLKSVNAVSFLQMVSHTLEMRPLVKARQKDVAEIEQKLASFNDSLLDLEPSVFGYEYQEFLDSVKTAMFILDWIEENDEEYLLEKYSIRPGEIRVKLDNADWLLYSLSELAKLSAYKDVLNDIAKLRLRIKHGAKEELLPLLRLKGIGRIRARKMYKDGITDIGRVKKADPGKLIRLLGRKVALDVLDQLGVSRSSDFFESF